MLYFLVNGKLKAAFKYKYLGYTIQKNEELNTQILEMIKKPKLAVK